MKYIDADKLKAEIDKRYTEYRAKMKTDDFTYYEGMADALDLFEQFLDILPEQEHPIYELNQILLDWMREAKTDKEQEARFEAYKRFFELYDEYMMQEPEQPVEGIEDEYARFAKTDHHQYQILLGNGGIDLARHFAEWQRAKMLDGAVEAVVTTNLANRPIIYLDQLQGFQYGDKVKVIVIKED